MVRMAGSLRIAVETIHVYLRPRNVVGGIRDVYDAVDASCKTLEIENEERRCGEVGVLC